MRKGILVSRAQFPIVIKYDGQDMVISPRSTVTIQNIDLLESNLPKELQLRIQ